MTEAPQPRLLSTSQVATLTGATLRQLQWWDEQGHLCPRRIGGAGGNGKCRRYTAEQLGRARLYLKLRGKGIKGDRCWPIVERVWPLSGGYLLIQGLRSYVVANAQEAAELAARKAGPVVVLRWD